MSETWIEVHRAITGVEYASICVDDETANRIRNKTITREELNNLIERNEYDVEWGSDIYGNDLPHAVYIPQLTGYPEVYEFEEN